MLEFTELEIRGREKCNDGTSLVVRWIDKRQVLMITIQHRDKLARSGKVNPKTTEPVIKPEFVHDHNCSMGGVTKVI